MTPAARIASTIEVLELIDASPRPADEIVSGYFRARRFIGAKDRRNISERVFAVERQRARLEWWTGSQEPRARVIAELAFHEGLTPESAATLFDGGRFGPAPLSQNDAVLVERLTGTTLETSEMPDDVRLEAPAWLLPSLQRAWGDGLDAEMAALNRPAALDLRVNTLKGDRTAAIAQLAKDGIEATPTPLSPLGLRVTARVNLTGSRAYKDGLIEIQDEASQLAALLVGTRADRHTIDLCAGAGGKTLALAARMKDGGPLVACDTDPQRLKQMEARLSRAGVTNVTRKRITGPQDPFLATLADRSERVLVDAPCSGAGAWRRHPGNRWRLTPERLAHHIAEQSDILIAASALVQQGGRLIYVTCSILPEENQDQADHFLEFHPDFRALPITQLWGDCVGGTCPVDDTYLSLTPAKHGTDGFFVAVFEKT